MESTNQKLELGFDRPLRSAEALQADKLGRRGYADSAVCALSRVNSTTGFALSVEGAWGSGKTSTLSMIEALLRTKKPAPVIVHFNPWLVGDRDALLRHFLSKIAAEVKLADHAADGKRVARELKAYSKVFDLIKLIPGAEPWASMVKSVFEAAEETVESASGYKTSDVEARKSKVEEALRKFERPIIIFIDDIDRLFPLEVFEMIRIVKAVGDLPNLGYVLAWDPEYVSDALTAAGVPRSQTYLDKVIQVRLPLPAIGTEARGVLINEALSRLHPDAHNDFFTNARDRLATLYFSGLREVLEQPRDYARVFNTVAVVEPLLRGEVVLADIVGFSALMVKAPSVYELMRKEPRWFVGPLPGDQSFKKTEEILKKGVAQREKAFDECGHPRAVRKMVHRLFPLTARADDELMIGRALEVEGHIAAPERLLVALQLHVSGSDVSIVEARRYLVHPEQRSQIAKALTVQNCLAFLECLGDVAESTASVGVDDVEELCVDIARLVDTEPFPSKSQDRSSFFRLSAEDVALRAIRLVLKAVATDKASVIAERIVAQPEALTVAMELFVASYLVDKEDKDRLRCSPESKAKLANKLASNVLKAATVRPLPSGQKSNKFNWLVGSGISIWDSSACKAHESSVFSKTETDKICRQV